VALTAFDLLASIVATLFATYPGSLHRLAVDNPDTGLRVSLEAHPHTVGDARLKEFDEDIWCGNTLNTLKPAVRASTVGTATKEAQRLLLCNPYLKPLGLGVYIILLPS